jgi:hypothetical protein
MSNQFFRWSPLLTIAVATALSQLGSARAQDSSLHVEVTLLAKDIHSALPAGESALAVGNFTASSRLPASAGPAITLALRRELAKREVTIREDARLRVEGTYADVIDKESGGLAVALIAKFVDQKTGKDLDPPIKLKPRGVFGDASISALLGLSVEFSPNSSRKERDDALKIAIDKPAAKLHTAKYQPSIPAESVEVSAGNSKLRMEILIKNGDDYVPRAAKLQDGEAFVRIERNEVYAVRLINDYHFEIAVQLNIDGLSLFAFADAVNPKSGRSLHSVILPPRNKGTVYGWYRNSEQVNEFLVTEYAKSAAGALKSVANVGSITATYCASWPEDGSPPEDEPPMPPRYAKSADATARGQIINKASETVERNFGVVRGSVTVRYSK